MRSSALVVLATVAWLYHVTSAGDWAAAVLDGEYRLSTRDTTLEAVGFIHASYAHQVVGVADNFYRGLPDLVVLVIDPAAVRAEIREDPNPTSGERFPHIYGPLNVDAVVAALPLAPGTGRALHAPARRGPRRRPRLIDCPGPRGRGP